MDLFWRRLSALVVVTVVSVATGPVSGVCHETPRVIVSTDINIDSGDPDDRQSMAHLLMHAIDVDVRGLLPYRFNAGGVEASLAAIEAYEQDYNDPATQYRALDYPTPGYFRSVLARSPDEARSRLIREAHAASEDDPLYVLVWGNMRTLREALFEAPEIAAHLRVITIGTNLRAPTDDGDCKKANWNGGEDRQAIYTDPRFHDLWWVEIDWTYNGMFEGPEPRRMLDRVKSYGALGRHIWSVVQSVDWADYFRAGDTPSLLYVLDSSRPLDDPTQPSWAGRFVKPFPETRPNYYTGVSPGIEWNYADPCTTWSNARAVQEARVQTLLDERQEMYDRWLEKLDELYGK